MYLRASEMSKQAWSEAVKTNNLEEHMLLDPLYYSFGDKEQKCWGGGVQVNVGGVQNMLGGCKLCNILCYTQEATKSRYFYLRWGLQGSGSGCLHRNRAQLSDHFDS